MDWVKKTANSILYLQNFLLSFLDHFLQYKLNIIFLDPRVAGDLYNC